MNRVAGLVLLAAFGTLSGCQGDPVEPDRPQTMREKLAQDGGRLQGTWKLVLLRVDGETAPREKTEKARVVIASDQLTMRKFTDGEDVVVTYQLDVLSEPRQFDLLTPNEGKVLVRGGYVGKGIYKFEGEELTMCFRMPPVSSRPAVFESAPNSNVALWVLRKER
ncbi:MAG: TIGR03067 domain-containing protein [Gemmataceae bacterium]|nr:TIGR03067 domain-containing protein [Gemmataceae bacterium]